VLRGGSWNNIRRDAQTTSRFSTEPDDWYNDIGFRIVGAVK
jgi:formylglycine-generating enzyme required for sulfatase activity